MSVEAIPVHLEGLGAVLWPKTAVAGIPAVIADADLRRIPGLRVFPDAADVVSGYGRDERRRCWIRWGST